MDELIRLGQLTVSLVALVWIVRLFIKGYLGKKVSGIFAATKDTQPVPAWVHTLYIGAIATFVVLEFVV